MSKQKVMIVKCDRCGRQENLEEMKGSHAVVDSLKYQSPSQGWSVVQFDGESSDLCPSCKEKFRNSFDNFMRIGMMETGGPLG